LSIVSMGFYLICVVSFWYLRCWWSLMIRCTIWIWDRYLLSKCTSAWLKQDQSTIEWFELSITITPAHSR
jgi:hypothetical protein